MPASLKKQAAQARQIAEQKLMGTGYVLCQCKPFHYIDGWRFPVKTAGDPDPPENAPMVVTVLVRMNELKGK